MCGTVLAYGMTWSVKAKDGKRIKKVTAMMIPWAVRLFMILDPLTTEPVDDEPESEVEFAGCEKGSAESPPVAFVRSKVNWPLIEC
jgi:hypothetical protein